MGAISYEEKKIILYGGMDRLLSPVPHYHKEMEIIYVKKGKTIAHADNMSFEMKSGDIFISFPKQIHYYEETEVGSYYVFIISPKVFYTIDLMLNTAVPQQSVLSLDDNEELKHYVDYAMVASRSNTYQLKAIGYLNLILDELIPKMDIVDLKNTDRDNDILMNVIDYCTSHYNEPISLTILSNEFNLSQSYLSRIINNRLKMGLNDYINSIRIRQACRLLADTNLQTIEISEDVGFGSVRTFNRTFLKIMNNTPLKYRAECQKIKTSEDI